MRYKMDILRNVREQECREESGAGVSWTFQKTIFKLMIPL
jgi:hypothetical protein